VRRELTEELNLPQDVLLIAGAHDQVCAALGAGVLQKGECVDGIGTSECITSVLDDLDKKAFMMENNFCIEPYAIDGEYVTLAFSASGMSIMSWFGDEIARAATPDAPAFAVLEEECPKEPTNIFVLPHFSGSGTPHMDPFSLGATLGLRLSTTRGEYYKACMEGLCFEMKLNAELLAQMGTSIKSVSCVGGGSRSDILLQMKADIMGIPVKRLKKEESGTAALAMLCATACGDYQNLKDAAAQIVVLDRIFEPNSKNQRVYLQKFELFQKIYPSLKQLNHFISAS
jgi:xylulokinase